MSLPLGPRTMSLSISQAEILKNNLYAPMANSHNTTGEDHVNAALQKDHINYTSHRLLSFLYSDRTGDSSSTAFSIDSGYGDYDEIIQSVDDESVQDAFVEGSQLWSLLVVGYSIVFIVGVIGNTFLLAALCGTGSRARALPVRNHLMVNLACADLLVRKHLLPFVFIAHYFITFGLSILFCR